MTDTPTEAALHRPEKVMFQPERPSGCTVCEATDCDEFAVARCLCRKHWKSWRAGDEVPGADPREDRSTPKGSCLDALVAIVASDAEQCIAWPCAVDQYGYGKFGKRYVTHLVLERTGRIRPTPAHEACHSCDLPECVNPAHLRWCPHSENMQEARASILDCGSANDIRTAKAGGESAVDLAVRFGVSRETIDDVVAGRTWADCEAA